MSHVEFQTEAKKCIEIHSHLSTCLYDWAFSHTLYEQQVLCWSTTAAYYAMVHSARTLFSLTEFDERFKDAFGSSRTKRERLREIVKFHSQFCSFLKDHNLGQNDKVLRKTCLECFEDHFPNVNWSSFLKNVGRILELHKDARNAETYEHFVVAHHGRGYHFESPFINTIFQESERNANKLIVKTLSYVHDFYEKENPMREYHLWHLKDEIKWLETPLKKEKLEVPSEMQSFLNSLKSLTTDISKPVRYSEFEREMDMNYYTRKGEVYGKLKSVAEGLMHLRERRV